ncbi:DUF6286 domain-containing protein [Streptomyces sp. SCL15-4]|uniref:DUF6286 domain-containing protein n=1 Tax=Streptomyces sp. SCL15-4 TaxID=2967221 RepID=UPI0029667D83|nr:DUF6286 domain-containing protein [Streptomyces sp. SCL15-4]
MTPDPVPPGRETAPDPGPPGRGPTPSGRPTVPLTKEPGPPGRAGTEPDATAQERGGGRRTHRPWSARRLPAALVAAVILVAAVAALADVVAVRAGGSSAAWRRHLTDALATRPLDDVWMLTGAAVAAAVGLWLIALALTPGLRQWLPLRSTAGCPRLRASLDRDGAAGLLRDAALRVPGVGAARVRVRRHRVKARADVRFRDPRQVEDDLTAVLDEERDRLALAAPPRIVVRVRQRTG